MGRTKEKKIFTGVLDTDSDLKDIAQNNYPYALNHSSNPDAFNTTVGKNRKGTIALFKALPEGENVTIGTVSWIEKKAVIYFIKNSNNNHCIRALYSDYTIEDILYSEPKLKFTVDFIPKIIGDLLCWTDGVIEPRALLISKAIEYTKSYKFDFINVATYGIPQGSYIGFSGLGTFMVGEKVFVQQDDGYTNEVINGYATIIHKDAIRFYIDKNIYVSAQNQTGKVFRYNKDQQYYNIDDVILNAIKQPPLFPPVAQYEYVSTDNSKTNNLRGNLFQFCYRYKYDDNAYSVWSPVSKVSLPNGEMLANGVYNYGYINNYLKVTLNSGTNEVKEIDLAIRQSGLTKYTKVQTIRKYDENGDVVLDGLHEKYPARTEFDYMFNNSEYGVVLDDNEVTRLFDYVPITAGTMEILDENVIDYADIKEGYDSVKTDVELSYNLKFIEKTPLNYLPQWYNGTYLNTLQLQEISNANGLLYMYNIIFNYYDPLTDIGKTFVLILTRNAPPETQIYFYYTVSSINITKQDIINSFITQINNVTTGFGYYSPTESVSAEDGSYYGLSGQLVIKYRFNPAYVPNPNILIGYSKGDIIVKEKSFKLGAFHKLGIVYYDEAGNRCSDTNSFDKLYIPILSEISSYSNQQLIGVPYASISAKINHTPPILAKTWQFVYAGSSIDFKLCFGIKNLVANSTTPIKTIKITLGTEDMRNAYTNCKDVITNYTFQKGDRIRFLYHKVGTNFINQNKLYDYEIQSVTTSGEIIVENFFSGNPTFPVWIGDIVEIYHPLKQSETISEIYYEIGECYPVDKPYTSERSHGNTLTSEQNGVFEINSGDVYSFLRFPPSSTQYPYPCQSEHYSDYYISNTTDAGRPILDIWGAKQLKLGTMQRIGGKYIQNTKTNNIFRFINSDYRNSPEVFGKINAVLQRGQTIKVFQDKKVDSYYIGATSLTDMEGKNTLEKATQILGNRRASDYDYGCIHPHSIQKADNYIYYYDFNNGFCIIDSEGGGEILSNRLVSSYFKRMKDTLLAADVFDVKAVYNTQDREYLLTFIWGYYLDELSDGRLKERTIEYHTETIVFNEVDKGWKTFMFHSNGATPIEMYGKLNDKYISFIGGQPFINEQNELRNFNYGNQQKHIIDIVGNTDKEKVKVWNAIELHTNNNKLNANIDKNLKSDLITIPPSSMYPNGMLSKLVPYQLVSKEGFITTSFNKNINSNKSGSEKYLLLNGDELRGEVIDIRLENSSDENVEIYSAIIQSTFSEKSV